MIDVKPTLAGLAEALNTLLANGVDPDAEVMTGVYEEEDGERGTIVFDGAVDVETLGGIGPKRRVILSTSEDYEVAPLVQQRFHCGGAKCVPIDDGSCYCGCAGCDGAKEKTAKWKARRSE